ncbi:hypothetical protein PVAG01_06529 [Phlyctema vagabunda]|uniref:Uncharacterized protein n=1 Tax=Phlyctema vagabunda TaxID=108571 RepID=A0ABR4PGB8_9HELO
MDQFSSMESTVDPPSSSSTDSETAAAEVAAYKQALADIIYSCNEENGFSNDVDAWAEFDASLLTPAVLSAAFQAMDVTREILFLPSAPATSSLSEQRDAAGDRFRGEGEQERRDTIRRLTARRHPKTLARICEKLRKGDDQAPRDYCANWKVNSDLSAFRIIVPEVEQVRVVARRFEEVVRQYLPSASICSREAYGKRDGKNSAGKTDVEMNEEHEDENERADVADLDLSYFKYVYLPSTGFVTEVQFVHPFAAWAFSWNSRNKHPHPTRADAEGGDEEDDNDDKGNPRDVKAARMRKQRLLDPFSRDCGDGDLTFYEAIKRLLLHPRDPGVRFDVRAAVEKFMPSHEEEGEEGRDEGDAGGISELAHIINPTLRLAGLREL